MTASTRALALIRGRIRWAFVIVPNGRVYHRWRSCQGFWRQRDEVKVRDAIRLGLRECGVCWR